MLKVEVDEVPTKVALNSVKVILGDRQVTVTHEGIIVDLIEDGEFTDSFSMTHDEMLAGKDSD